MPALALLLAALAWPAPRPLSPPAPEFPATSQWANSKPLKLADQLNRRVVLVAFLNTASINSVRTFKVLKRWHSRYAKDGLTVIGVHTPAYPFQLEADRVKRALSFYGLKFPVVLDNDKKVWEAFENDGWPAFYLISHAGKIIFDRLGEDGYSELEQEILGALDNIPGATTPTADDLAPDVAKTDCGPMTAEISAGLRKGRPIQLQPTEKRLSFLFAVRDGELGFQGPWSVGQDSLRLSQENPDWEHFTSVIYRGAQASVLLGHPKRKTRVYVRQDDLWMHPGNAGRDIKFDDDGRSFLETSGIRLYDLARNPNDAVHELSVAPEEPGTLVFGFSFSDLCLAGFLP